MTETPVRYRNPLMDSARWNGVELRDGDIIVTTPAKCGTTWTQIICGLLVFGQPELPKPLDELSPWVDAYFRDHDDLIAALAAQEHRRFMKSHTPLDGLPSDGRVAYVATGRDPRDVGVSMDHHMANMDMEAVMKIRVATMGPEAAAFGDSLPAPAPTFYERFWNWVDSDDISISLKGLLNHIGQVWERREEDNIVLMHYDELKADLDGQMRSLADALGIAIDEEVWPELVKAATFDAVRGNAETLTPENGIWKDKADFFHKGSSGQWKTLFDEDDLERYRARVNELTTPEIAEWLHREPF
ncbi:sulfotransferase domain-containing protein [Glycomyces arizonensis]|uniref:sulfotransferase domain-containing protein n=1 Tax=Glycomyces arizonensis TaxID=256035 RepID=UPI0003F75672|nr:sulfotransferase domain-containing protein [Glycomyces arizonensis]